MGAAGRNPGVSEPGGPEPTRAGGGRRPFPAIEPLGDAAVLVTLGDVINLEVNARVHELARQIRLLAERIEGIGRPVPAYATVLVPFDLELHDTAEVTTLLEPLVTAATEAPTPGEPAGNDADDGTPGTLVEVPVRYGGTDGPDLDAVARHHGLSPADVIELHAGTEYRVFFVGFTPGFAYLGPLPRELDTPRRATPRERVPPGSVGIAGRQTGVYPLATPGGWQLIGRTPIALWDPRRDPPAVLRPGMRVRFTPLGRA
jgi:inhibitor of KinA